MAFKNYNVSSAGKEKCSSKRNQILMSIVVSIPFFSYGAAMGWISPNKTLLMSNNSPSTLPFSEEEVSWMASIMFIFAPIAVFVYGAAADKFGRKYTSLCLSVPMALGWTVKLIYTHPIAFISARALIGFGAGGSFVLCPLYVKEISEDSIRGMTGSFVVFSQTVGNLFVYIIGDVLSFYTVLWILLGIPVLHFWILLHLPESPSFLLKCGKVEETAKVLGWLRALPTDHKSISEEIDTLIIQQSTCKPKFSPKALFSNKTTVKAFWVAFNVVLAREFCGCIAVLVYASHIFTEANKDSDTSFILSPNKQCILLGTVQIIGSFCACQLVDRSGRKCFHIMNSLKPFWLKLLTFQPLLAMTSIVSGCCMCFLGVWFYLQSIQSFMPGWMPIVALCLSIFADAAGLQPISFVIMTEMFNFELRTTVATIIMATVLGCDFVLLKIFVPLNTWIGYHSIFWLFSFICIANIFYVIFFVPETKMRKLEEIYADLEKKTITKKNVQTVETIVTNNTSNENNM